MPKDYLFSVVMPIYNVEQYLSDAIDSVLRQSIGFEKNIQLILVNDGSPDRCEAICAEYQQRYPQNIIYLEQDNRGISAARNHGLQYATGAFVNFMDSDDRWEENAFLTALKYIQAAPECVLFAARMKHFDGAYKYHALDDKFRESRRVDIFDKSEYNSVLLHGNSCFIKREVAEKYPFDPDVNFGEDTVFLTDILLDYGAYFVMREAEYYYRKRHSNDSAVQMKAYQPYFYSDTVRRYHLHMVQRSTEKYGKVLPYLQSLFLYEIGTRINRRIPDGVLSDAEQREYLDLLGTVLQTVSNDRILKNKFHPSFYRKAAMLRLKYKEREVPKPRYNREDRCIYIGKSKLTDVSKNRELAKIALTEQRDDGLYVEGWIKRWLADAACTKAFCLRCGETDYPVALSACLTRQEETIFGTGFIYETFHATLPSEELLSGSADALVLCADFGSEIYPISCSTE